MAKTLILKTIPLRIEDEFVDGTGLTAGALNSIKSTALKVEFVNWDGLSKFATFKNAKGQNAILIALTVDMEVEENIYNIPIPPEAMSEEGYFSVAFTGYTIEDGTLGSLVNTATAYFKVLSSDAVMDDKSVTEPLFFQLQSEIDLLKDDYHALPDRVAEAQGFANDAQASATSAATSATNAATSESNALSYRNRCEDLYDNIEGGFVINGRIDFDDLPPLASVDVGDTFIINDDFETTSDFNEGAGVSHVAGTEVFKIKNGKWDTKTSDVATLQAQVEELTDDLTSLGDTVSTQGDTIDTKVDKITGKGLSTEDFTSAEKTKLAGIQAGANVTTVDTALNNGSSNPVRNSVITSALGNKANNIHIEMREVPFVKEIEGYLAAGADVFGYRYFGSAYKQGYTALGILTVRTSVDQSRPDTHNYILGSYSLASDVIDIWYFGYALPVSAGEVAFVGSRPHSVFVNILYVKN